MTTEVHSLEGLHHQLAYGLENGAVFLYWHHRLQYFNYLTTDDQDAYHEELKLVRKQLRGGSITSVSSGTSITVGSKMLHTMNVTMANQMCYPNMLLQERGLLDDTDHTPYFFTSEMSRDNAVSYITRKSKGEGILGTVEAFGPAHEEQGRKTLHSHWQIWIKELNPKLRTQIFDKNEDKRLEAKEELT